MICRENQCYVRPDGHHTLTDRLCSCPCHCVLEDFLSEIFLFSRGGMGERLKPSVLKTEGPQGSGGSNPSPSSTDFFARAEDALAAGAVPTSAVTAVRPLQEELNAYALLRLYPMPAQYAGS